MAFTNYIQQIKGTNNTTYDLVDSSASHFVKGTQTAATNVWTGALPDGVTAYYDGLTIDYFLPYSGSGTAATLNLGGKGAKPVYQGNSASAVTTHFPQYSVIHLTYLVDSALNSGNGCWKATGYYNTNNYVNQTYSTSNTDYDMALSYYTSANSGSNVTYHSTKIKGNPSTGRVTTEDLSDSAIDAIINNLDVTGTYGSVEVKKLLWTNPSPTSVFAAQKINLNLADYDIVEIHAYAAMGTNYSQIVSSSADVGTTGTFIGIKPVEKAASDTTTVMQRSFEVANDGVTFTGGIYRLYSATTVGAANDVYIPYKIYGIKNNFNVGSISVVDNVIEQGTSGNWTYRKWNSGIGECWLQYNPGSYTVGTARGSLYSGGNLTLTFPLTFTSTPSVTGSVSLGTDAYVAWLQFNGLGTTTAQCRIASSGSIAANSNYLISVHVTGRWK